MSDAPIRIGQLAERTGVSVDTIRHYERVGVLPKPARTRVGYRQYSPSAIDRVMLIRHGLRFGFSLRDLSKFLQVRASGGAPCRDVRTAAERILAAVERQIVELTAAREAIRKTVEEWDRRLARTSADRPARLLDSLTRDAALPTRVSRSNLKRTR